MESQGTVKHPEKSSIRFTLVIEAKEYKWPNQYINRAEILQLAHLSSGSELYLAVQEPWNDELVTDTSKINLGREGIEYFYVKRNLCLTLNGERHEWTREFINRVQLVRLGDLNSEDELFLKIAPPGKDELITENSKINLAIKGVEHFYSKETDKEVIIIVNGTPKKWDKKVISFKEVVILAYGNYIDRPTMVYTVAYEDGPKQNPEGSMVKGNEVFVKNKMIFHATATDKS